MLWERPDALSNLAANARAQTAAAVRRLGFHMKDTLLLQV